MTFGRKSHGNGGSGTTVLLAVLAVVGAKDGLAEKDDFDEKRKAEEKVDELELPEDITGKDVITLESDSKLCEICKEGNIRLYICMTILVLCKTIYSQVLRNGKPNSTKVVIYTRDGTRTGRHIEKRCTAKVLLLGAVYKSLQ